MRLYVHVIISYLCLCNAVSITVIYLVDFVNFQSGRRWSGYTHHLQQPDAGFFISGSGGAGEALVSGHQAIWWPAVWTRHHAETAARWVLSVLEKLNMLDNKSKLSRLKKAQYNTAL